MTRGEAGEKGGRGAKEGRRVRMRGEGGRGVQGGIVGHGRRKVRGKGE